MDNKFTSLKELIDSIEMGLDIECSIYGTDYYIGWSDDKRIIAECPNDEGIKFNSLNEMLEYKIKGIPLKDIWDHIVIDRM